MKFMKWKILIITCIVTLLPIIAGVALWNQLPAEIATHFDLNGNPDSFSSKGFAVFGIPLLMMLLQIICCIINDVKAHQHGPRVKFERVTKWIIPCMSIVLQGAIFAFALGKNVDTRAVALLLVGVIMIAIGNYLPKFDYIKNYNLDTEKARKINRFIGIETVIMGVLSIICIFLPPIFSLYWLFLLIAYAIIAVVYGIIVGTKK
ncbi:MAG: DUF1648 domain-containing protein [Clostridia bacterium]|nr:DUF1648 domain-containing protein [Clostridia bacterium]